MKKKVFREKYGEEKFGKEVKIPKDVIESLHQKVSKPTKKVKK